jgi:hypothetical protein
MVVDDDALAAMLAAVEALPGSPDGWGTSDGYDSVGLAILDAVWSIGVRYQSVENVVARYRAERIAGGHDPEADRPEDLRRFIEACGGPEEFASRMRNRQRTSTRNGILKAEAVLHEARILEREGIGVPADLAAAGEERLDHLRREWSTVTGQASGVSWRAFSMLVGLPDVKPDRMIRRFVAAALGRSSAAAVGVDEARDLVMAAAASLGVPPRDLDRAIWAHQSGNGHGGARPACASASLAANEVAQPAGGDRVVGIHGEGLLEGLLCLLEQSDRFVGAAEAVHGDDVIGSVSQDRRVDRDRILWTRRLGGELSQLRDVVGQLGASRVDPRRGRGLATFDGLDVRGQSLQRRGSVLLGEQVRVWPVRVGHERLARQVERVRVRELLVAVARRFVHVAPHVVRYLQAAAVDRVLQPPLVVGGVVRIPGAVLDPSRAQLIDLPLQIVDQCGDRVAVVHGSSRQVCMHAA